MLKKVSILLLLIILAKFISAQEVNLRDSLMFYYKKSDFTKAIFFSEQMVEKDKRIPNNDSALSVSLNNLGLLYRNKGSFDMAVKFHLESQDIMKIFFGTNHPEYAALLINLAFDYKELGNYAESRMLLEKAAKIFKSRLGAESSEYILAINNLSTLFILTGNYAESEQLQLEALRLRKKIKGEQSNDVALSLNNLAVLYGELGNYNAIESLYKEAIVIYKKNYGVDNLNYASALSNLANYYTKLYRFSEADTLFTQAAAIVVKVQGENHPKYALALNEKGSLYQSMGKFKEAESIFLQSADIRKKVLGENHPDYSISLNNLAGLYFSMGNYEKAESLFLQSLQIKKMIYDEQHISYVNNIYNLAILYSVDGNYKKADSNCIAGMSVEKKLILNKLDYMSENELMAYIKKRQNAFEFTYSNLLKHVSPNLIQSTYDNRLLLTGITVQNTSNLVRLMEQMKDSSIVKLWKDYKNNKQLLDKLLTIPVTRRIINSDSLINSINQQEKTLLRQSADYRDIKSKLNITWNMVRDNLKPGEAAIEFSKFNYFNKTKTDTVLYAAMLIRPEDAAPVFLQLFDEDQLKAALKKFVYAAPVQIRGNKSIVADNSGSDNLYNLLWRPLLPYLTKTNTVYFSPDGLLHQIAFAAIATGKDSLLCDKYQLIQLTSTREIVNNNRTATKFPVSFALFGGINYNSQQTDTAANITPDPYAYVYQQNRSAGLDSFQYLPATLLEVTDIKKSLELSGKKPVLFTGKKATEAVFRSMSGMASPEVMHFATHGFTLPDTSKQKSNDAAFKISDNPLLRSGLVLAGGNKGWQGKSNPIEDDGILTALEISSVPLQNTQLAVLSGCETGTGEIRGSEGVFGLQRAFKLAGVKYIIASLWQVPDKETREFMAVFYNHWLNGKNIQQSFLTTQKDMHKKYPPYYWAAFTLVH